MVPLIEFDSTLPDDSTWTDTDDILLPSGHNVAVVIVSWLNRNGILCSSPAQHSYYGWYWTARIDGVPLWMMVQSADPHILQINDGRFILQRMCTPKAFFETLKTVKALLFGLTELSGISWYDRDKYNRFGPTPDAAINW